MKINKNNANAYSYYEKYNKEYYIYIVQELRSQELHIFS